MTGRLKCTVFIGAVISLMLAASCGFDNLGVLTIEFILNPTEIEELPEGITEDDLAGLDLAHGDVHVDVIENEGVVTADDLPALPDGFEYEVILHMAHHERDGLMSGDHHEEEEHGHGEGEEGEEHGEELETVSIGHMHSMGGSWMIEFHSDDIHDHSMGTVRACQVIIEPPVGEHMTVLFGQVEITGGDTDGGGHVHGV